MRYPYERYLRYLVTRGLDVDAELAKVDLPSTGTCWMPDCRRYLRGSSPPPALLAYINGDAPTIASSTGLREWADKEDLDLFWEQQSELGGAAIRTGLKQAFSIFGNCHARAIMALLLMSRATPTEIETLLAERFNAVLDDTALNIYRRVFWDISMLSREEWEAFARLLTGDERHYVTVGFSQRPSLEEVRHLLGMDCSVDPLAVVRNVMVKAHFQFNEAMERPNHESSNALRWGELAMKAAGAVIQNKPAEDAKRKGPGDWTHLFTVKMEKKKIIGITEIQGELAAPPKAKIESK